MRCSYTQEEAERLIAEGKAISFQKSIVLMEEYFPEYLWDKKYRIYRLTTFVSKEDLKDQEV